MATPSVDADARILKRHAPASSARAVAALDAAIWTSIIEFLPIPEDLNTRDAKKYDATVSDIVATWKTVLNLRLVTRELATLLHPVENKALWRKLLLQSFDFTVLGGAFNMENYQEEHGLKIPEGEEDEEEEDEEDDDDEEEEEEAETTAEADSSEKKTDEQQTGPSETVEDLAQVEAEQGPQVVAMRGRYYTMPPNYLEEDLVSWSKLGIYHRPSQYGFLTTLQQQPPVGVWPESEDPFTLFGDLVRLLQLPHGDRMVAGGEGSDTTFKFLAAPSEADSSSRFYRFYVMKTLGYVPHFWHWARGIGKEWKGFTDPDPFESADEDRRSGEENEDEEEEEDEDFNAYAEFAFPDCMVREAKRLYRHVRHHCRDWRSVCCNKGYDGYTPVFFVGESKELPHRWTGYAGGKCWT